MLAGFGNRGDGFGFGFGFGNRGGFGTGHWTTDTGPVGYHTASLRVGGGKG